MSSLYREPKNRHSNHRVHCALYNCEKNKKPILGLCGTKNLKGVDLKEVPSGLVDGTHKRLTHLRFDRNFYIESLSSLSSLVKLVYLDISYTGSLSDTPIDLSFLTSTKKMVELKIVGLDDVVGHEAIGSLTDLQILDASKTNFDISSLKGLKKLEWLNLSYSKWDMSTSSLQSLLKTLPKLKVLSLTGTNVGDINWVNEFPNLEVVFVANTNVANSTESTKAVNAEIVDYPHTFIWF